jgi:transcriptional regulator with XRE-family HTH domain
MPNRIKELRLERGWSQDDLANAINAVLDSRPDLKKITRKNPDGLIDRQTAQRLEAEEIDLTPRYLTILQEIFGMTPNEILGITSDDELKLLQWWRETSQKRRRALLDWIDEK